MCNLYRLEKAPDAIVQVALELGASVAFPEGVPNQSPGEVRITDPAPVLRSRAGEGECGALEWVTRRWSWPNAQGKPLFNMRGEGRRFPLAERCVALADAFFEHTAPKDPKTKRKDRWLFRWPEHPWFGIAAIWRADRAVGEAFTLLTCEPGPDVAPIHPRQVALLSPADCLRWLDPASDPAALLGPLPAGSLTVSRA